MDDTVTDFQSKKPRVSVILTVYKRTNYLADALNSVLVQTYENFEVIVADDSGTAASRDIVAGHKDARVRYLPNPTTLGITRSLVRAANQARGQLISVLNDDDVWTKDLLAELTIPFQREAGCVASFADHWVMDENGRI